MSSFVQPAPAAPRRKRRAYAARVPVEQRRAQLLDAALHLIVTRGHNATTMEAVAEAVGVTKPVVYGQFANRAELLSALLRREGEQALADLLAVLPDGDAVADPAELLAGSIAGFLDAVRANPDRWYCVVMPMPDMPAQFHAAREAARRITLARAQRLAARLFGDALDAELLAHTMVSLFEMAARLVLTEPDRFTPARFEHAIHAAVGLATQWRP